MTGYTHKHINASDFPGWVARFLVISRSQSYIVGAKPLFSHPSSGDNKKCPTHKVILRNKLINMCNPYPSAWHIVASLKLAHG